MMTDKEIDDLADSLTAEYLRYKKEVSIRKFIRRVIEVVNLYYKEKNK